jgi:hypothetical protein
MRNVIHFPRRGRPPSAVQPMPGDGPATVAWPYGRASLQIDVPGPGLVVISLPPGMEAPDDVTAMFTPARPIPPPAVHLH